MKIKVVIEKAVIENADEINAALDRAEDAVKELPCAPRCRSFIVGSPQHCDCPRSVIIDALENLQIEE